MTIKSLLLGSAAALAAVSGAQAADAIVAAEPEPMEYVKVCDAAGAGYFYIPGSETCLKFDGFIRYRNDYNFSTKAMTSKFEYEYYTRTWNDTEYGAAYSTVRFKGSSTTNTAMSAAADGYFGIGGLELGLYDNQWSRFFGYGAHGISGGAYGFGSGQYVSYTASLGSATVLGAIDWIAAGKAGYVLGLKGSVGDWSAAAAFAYDSSAAGYSVKGSLSGALGIANLKLMALYGSKATIYSSKDFTVIGSVSAPVTDAVTLIGKAQWQTGGAYWVAGEVDWAVASGFLVQAELGYTSSTKATASIVRVKRSW